MARLKDLVNRVLPPKFEHPPSPAEAANSFPSHIFSADDDVAASPRLLEVAYQAIEAAANQVSLDEIAARPRIPAYFNSWPGEHYRLLAGFMLALKPKRVIEITTSDGLSTLAMKKYLPEDGRIVTFDRERWDMLSDTFLTSGDFADNRLKQEVGDLAFPGSLEQHRETLTEAEFIFIDDRADGITEQQLIDNLRTISFKSPPLVVCDDTRLWSMLKFWRDLPFPKLDLTSFGHWSGTGLFELQ
jgi:hypothetical protein